MAAAAFVGPGRMIPRVFRRGSQALASRVLTWLDTRRERQDTTDTWT